MRRRCPMCPRTKPTYRTAHDRYPGSTGLAAQLEEHTFDRAPRAGHGDRTCSAVGSSASRNDWLGVAGSFNSVRQRPRTCWRTGPQARGRHA